jgi:hypothetical protein
MTQAAHCVVLQAFVFCLTVFEGDLPLQFVTWCSHFVLTFNCRLDKNSFFEGAVEGFVFGVSGKFERMKIVKYNIASGRR